LAVEKCLERQFRGVRAVSRASEIADLVSS
jgi:hypothetical protein